MSEIPLEWYISPISKKPLILKDSNTLMDEDGNEFTKNVESGYWDFMVESSPHYTPKEWLAWEKLIENFIVSFENDPEHNVSYVERDDALYFGEFINYHGRVIDLGCGPHACPSYIKYRRNDEATYYGLDPLHGVQPKEYNFVKGMGEHLPFKDDLFDISIYATSLLHFVDPKAGIREALRITKPDGYFAAWVGEKSRSKHSTAAVKHDWYEDLQTPEGADNPFHYSRFGVDDFEKFVEDCQGKIIAREVKEVPNWGYNVYYKIQK